MGKRPGQWLEQADYDMDTAQFLFDGGRCFYAVFMCHLSIEKALKGLYQARLGATPPRTHSLIYLLDAIEIKPGEAIAKFLVKLGEAHVATRYPEDLETLQQNYTRPVVGEIVGESRKALEWIRAQY